MIEPRLTPAESAALDKRARQWTHAGGLVILIAFGLFVAAIWTGDIRFAYTGGLVVIAAIVVTLTGAVLNTPDRRKALAAKLREQEEP